MNQRTPLLNFSNFSKAILSQFSKYFLFTLVLFSPLMPWTVSIAVAEINFSAQRDPNVDYRHYLKNLRLWKFGRAQ